MDDGGGVGEEGVGVQGVGEEGVGRDGGAVEPQGEEGQAGGRAVVTGHFSHGYKLMI